MSNRAKFTDQFVRNLKPDPDGRRITYWDSSTTGFGLRITGKGVKSFFFWFRPPGALKAEKRRLTLGKYPQTSLVQARDLARKAHAQVLAGQDPVADKRRRVEEARRERAQATTFGEFATIYMAQYPQGVGRKNDEPLAPHTARMAQGILDNHVLPRWGNRRIADITSGDVEDLLREVRKAARHSPRSRGAAGQPQFNRVRARVHHMFGWGIKRSMLGKLEFSLDANPVSPIDRADEESRDRVLSDDELRRFWSALDELEPVAGGVFKLMLMLGQRGGEVKSMRWEDINREAEDGWWWTIPPHLTKTKTRHDVPLPAEAQRLLVELSQAQEDDIYVFPGLPGRPVTHTNRTFRRACRVAEIENFRPHDLRHCATTAMTGLGIPRSIVGKVLGHSEQSITKTYDHSTYEKQKREALDAWAQKLTQILAGAKVVRLEEVAS